MQVCSYNFILTFTECKGCNILVENLHVQCPSTCTGRCSTGFTYASCGADCTCMTAIELPNI